MEWVVLINTVISSAFGIIVLVIGGRINSKIEKQKNDYSLYNEKKHIHYAEAYKLLKEAEGHNVVVPKVSGGLILIDFNTEDIDDYVKGFMPRKMVLEVRKLWDNNKFEEARKLITNYKENSDKRHAEQKIVDANNYCHANELYFESGTFKLLLDYIDELFKHFYDKQAGKQKTEEKTDDLKCQLEEIKICMLDDLSIAGNNKKKKK
ncbi:hypothetical protein MH111_11775 [Bacillus altitudinis]|uniref:hypothetical protein n=1 Tax=Bacillus altitudinis TaxID=293387 RepID=UPI0022802EE1|nr:hypothetical protein [Bacillus altitudinis]MCY7691124.1 hypothetical protein [Bacillus altitudinis]